MEHRIAVARKNAVAHGEADQLLLEAGLLLLHERVLSDEVTLGQLHQPREVRFERRHGVVDVVAVQGHAHLEPERVAGSEARWRDLARRHQRLPDGHRGVVRDVQLEAILAGVARTRDDGFLARDFALGKVVVLDGGQVGRGERLKDGRRLRTLDGEQRHLIRRVVHRHAKCRGVADNMRIVLRRVARVHDHHHLVGEPVDEAVVLDGAAVIEYGGVMHLAHLERGDVVRRHMVDEVHGASTIDPELAHVRDIEDPAALAHRLVLGSDASGILHGHLVAGEGHDLGAERDMELVEGRPLERSGGVVRHISRQDG